MAVASVGNKRIKRVSNSSVSPALSIALLSGFISSGTANAQTTPAKDGVTQLAPIEVRAQSIDGYQG